MNGINKTGQGIVLAGLLLILLFPAVISAKTVDVVIAGSTEKVQAFEQHHVVYFSFSELADIIGGHLDWELVGHEVTYTQDTIQFSFLIGSPFFKINNNMFNMTYPATFRKGQLFLPALTFTPFLDREIQQKITWNNDRKLFRIDSEYFNVTDLSVSAKANGLLIEIFLTQALPYEVFVTEGNWINVSIRDGKLNRARILSRKDKRYMYNLKAHQVAGAGQVSIRLRRKIGKWHHKLQYDPPRIQISIADTSFVLNPADTQPVIGPDNKIDVIVIDPGHGGRQYGAIGPNGTREKDIALGIAKRLAKLIRKDKQFKVIMTRDRDKTVSLQERADIANKAGADLFISIHANSTTRRKSRVRGWNVFFLAQALNDSARAVAQFENSAFLRDRNAFEIHNNADDMSDNPIGDPVLTILNDMIMTEFQAESYDFAMMVDREFRRSLKIPARGVDQAGFFVLNMVFTPSVLVEVGFISNKQEEKLLKSKKYQQKVAEAIYRAIKRFKAKYEHQ